MGQHDDAEPCRCRLCDPDIMALYDEQERHALDVIQRHGWLVTNIESTTDGLPGWAFTSGLTHSFGWPELVMTGLPSDVLHPCLNSVGERARRGEPWFLGADLDDVLEGYDVVLRGVDPRWNSSLFGWSQWFEQHREPAFVHVVWPDRAGAFPMDEGCDPAIRDLQPDLSVAPHDHPHGVWRAWAADVAWPGRQQSRGMVFVSRSVVDADAPVLLVGVDDDGDWSFTDGSDAVDASEVALAHVFHLLLRDPELEQHIELVPGQTARRSEPGAPWYVSDDADDQ